MRCSTAPGRDGLVPDACSAASNPTPSSPRGSRTCARIASSNDARSPARSPRRRSSSRRWSTPTARRARRMRAARRPRRLREHGRVAGEHPLGLAPEPAEVRRAAGAASRARPASRAARRGRGTARASAAVNGFVTDAMRNVASGSSGSPASSDATPHARAADRPSASTPTASPGTPQRAHSSRASASTAASARSTGLATLPPDRSRGRPCPSFAARGDDGVDPNRRCNDPHQGSQAGDHREARPARRRHRLAAGPDRDADAADQRADASICGRTRRTTTRAAACSSSSAAAAAS